MTTYLHIVVDPATQTVQVQWWGQTTSLTISRKLVFDLAQTLAARPGEFYRKDDLINALYGAEEGQEIYEDSLFQLITSLRRVLDPVVQTLAPAMTESCIQNVRGVGYRLLDALPVGEGK